MKYLTTKEAATYLGYKHDATVRQKIIAGKLKAIRFGNRSWQISLKALEDYKKKYLD